MKKNWVFNEIYEPVILIDSKLKILKANKNFVMMVKGSQSLLNNGKMLVSDVFPDNSETFESQVLKVQNSLTPSVSKELTGKIKGENFKFTFKIAPFESHFLIFFRDLTVEYKIHQQLKLLEKNSHSMSESPFFQSFLKFNSGLADNINQILFNCLSELNDLKKNAPAFKVPKNLSAELSKLGKTTRLLTRLSLADKDLLEILSAHHLIESFLAKKIYPTDAYKNRIIDIDIDVALSNVFAITQQAHLEDIIEVGFQNAIDEAQGAGLKRFKASFILRTNELGDFLEITVKNLISPDEVKFKRYENVPFLDSKPGNLGLGLYYAHHAADYFGYELKSEYQDNYFYFTLKIPLMQTKLNSGRAMILLTDDLKLALKVQKISRKMNVPALILHPDGPCRLADYKFKDSDLIFFDLQSQAFSLKFMHDRLKRKEIQNSQLFGLLEGNFSNKEIYKDMSLMSRELKLLEINQLLDS